MYTVNEEITSVSSLTLLMLCHVVLLTVVAPRKQISCRLSMVSNTLALISGRNCEEHVLLFLLTCTNDPVDYLHDLVTITLH